ncbi:hypothetical protein Tco_0938771 [Tanacetum coccineum]|uniref:Gag-Pol polyprotein n=1 Tax=Tanacetum coccineum TaxID=301880 RepID=A0ABQ5DI69_9ASTR
MNELTRNNLQVTTMQVNVQFLQQLQPEWSRFVTLVKQSEKIDTISYHRLFDILKQFQKEVNDIRAERIAKSANPLALLALAHHMHILTIQATKTTKIKCNIIFHKTKCIYQTQRQREQANWLEDTDEEIDEQELEAHYSYMAKIQEVYLKNPVNWQAIRTDCVDECDALANINCKFNSDTEEIQHF